MRNGSSAWPAPALSVRAEIHVGAHLDVDPIVFRKCSTELIRLFMYCGPRRTLLIDRPRSPKPANRAAAASRFPWPPVKPAGAPAPRPRAGSGAAPPARRLFRCPSPPTAPTRRSYTFGNTRARIVFELLRSRPFHVGKHREACRACRPQVVDRHAGTLSMMSQSAPSIALIALLASDAGPPIRRQPRHFQMSSISST